MSRELRVAGAQIAVTRDVGRNVETLRRAIDYAVAEKADILLTPEGSRESRRMPRPVAGEEFASLGWAQCPIQAPEPLTRGGGGATL